MLAPRRALGLSCAFCGVLTAGAIGCSSKDHTAASNAPDAGADAGKPSTSRDPHHVTQDDDESDFGNESDAGHASDAGPATDGDQDDDAIDPCAVPDDPDDDFDDTNCDGIDGDKSNSIFVATSGSDSAEGSFERPVATLVHAISLATAVGKDVYACAGAYRESLVLQSKGIRVYGGYECAQGWKRGVNLQARVSGEDIGLVIKNVTHPVLFDRVDIEGYHGASPGSSSIAVVAPLPGNNAGKVKRCGVAEDALPSCTALNQAGFTFALQQPW